MGLGRLRNIFLFGTLLDTGLRDIVLGRGGVPTKACELRGHAVRCVADASYPTIVEAPGQGAPGVCLCGVDDDAVARLDFYEGAFGYTRREVRVRGPDGDFHAECYFPPADQEAPGDKAWDLDGWRAEWAPLSRSAAREAMKYLGLLDAPALGRAMPMIRSRAAARLNARNDPAPAGIRSTIPASAVSLKHEEVAHIGFFTTRAYELHHPLLGGGQSPLVRREVFMATDAAIVLPYDPQRDRVLMVEQFRMGPFGRDDPLPWMLEPVAGRVDPGETPAEAARRECREEAGLTLNRLERIGGHYASPGCSTEYFHCFIGICNLEDGAAGLSGGLDGENEDIRCHLLSFDGAMALLETGEADNGPLIVSLLWLARERARLLASA